MVPGGHAQPHERSREVGESCRGLVSGLVRFVFPGRSSSHPFARQLAGVGTVVRGRAFDSGQKILIGRRLLTVDDGRETIRGLVAQADRDRVAADILRTDG